MSIVTPVVLSGGAGTRLWPSSLRANPKQFQTLTGERSLLRLALERVAAGPASPFGPAIVVGAQAHAELIRRELGGVDPEPMLVLEPVGRNTAACAAVAALLVAERAGPEALLLLAPADHHMDDEAAFAAAATAALVAARDGWIVTFGITPSHPDTGLGYVRAGAPLGAVFEAEAFVEKPDLATAKRYLAEGGYFWNGGYFLFRADRMIQELQARQPAILQACRAALAGADRSGGVVRLDPDAFAACPSDSIDYAVMEGASKVAVAPLRLGWSDLGSWASVWDSAPRDADANAASGDVLLMGSSGCLVQSDGPTVAVVDGTDLIVIVKDGRVLVAPRASAQKVKAVVEALKAAGREDLL